MRRGRTLTREEAKRFWSGRRKNYVYGSCGEFSDRALVLDVVSAIFGHGHRGAEYERCDGCRDYSPDGGVVAGYHDGGSRTSERYCLDCWQKYVENESEKDFRRWRDYFGVRRPIVIDIVARDKALCGLAKALGCLQWLDCLPDGLAAKVGEFLESILIIHDDVVMKGKETFQMAGLGGRGTRHPPCANLAHPARRRQT